MTKRLLAVLLALLIVVGCLPVAGATGAGSEFSDMPDNWSTVALKSAVANGLLIGDNGKIMPENPLTRAQMATIIVRAFGATEEGDISAYTDVKSTDWFASSIAKAYKMGVMEGYAGKMNPDNNITREQAFAVLARALKLEKASKCNKTFEDISNVSSWATGEIYAMVNAGYIQGANGKLNPQSNISRAEFAQAMYNLMQQYIVQEGEYTETPKGNVMVNVPGVTLKGLTVKGDLIIGDGVGDGNVILDDVVVTGRLVIRGGGKNSIIIRGSSNVSNVIATRVDGAVRVKVEGDAKVETIYVDDGSDDIIIVGSVGSVEVAAGNITVTATVANIDSANISGSGSALIVGASSKIGDVNVTATNTEVNVEGNVNNITTSAANTSVTGKGSVNKVEVKQGADGAKIETPKTEITVSEGVSDVTAGGGTKVEGGSTVTNNENGIGVEEPSTGGGGGGPITVEVSAISVEPTTMTLTVGETGTITAIVSPDDATNKKVNWSSSDESVATVDDKGNVTAVAEGTATITATSDADSSKKASCEVTVAIAGTFESTGSVGIAPESAGEAAGKIYAEYKLVAGEGENAQDISLAEGNVDYIKVKVGEGDWETLTANTDATLWFNVEADQGTRAYEVKAKDGNVYTATLNWDKEIKTATWEATDREGEHEGVTYVEYKLKDGEDGENQVSLKEGEVKLIASRDPGETKWVALEPNTDATLWFNKAKKTGNYDFFVVTKDGVMYKATLDWTETIAATIDYNAVWNETRGTWYIKVSVPDEDLDVNSIKSISTIKEAGEKTSEPVALTPDTDKVLWFGVVKGDGNTSLKTAGEYAYEVVRKDGTKYIFNFTYAPGSVTGATNLVQTALDAVNNASSADNYAAVKTALEENAAKLGLDLTEYEKLTPVGRQNAVANDIFNNKPEGGYTIETLKPMFDEIVATRMVFQESVAIFAAASTENPLTDLSYITMLQENLNAVTLQKLHSGRNIKDDILPELDGLVTDFGNLTTEQKTAVLAGIDYSKNTSSTATRNALQTAIDKVVADEEAAVKTALDAVNDYLTEGTYNYGEAPSKLESHLTTLGLDVGTESDYAALDKTATGGKNRKTAVFYDLNNNKPAEGYDLSTLTTYFNDMVATRLVTEESMDLVNNAENTEALNGISFVTKLLDRFGAVSYQTHSDIPVAEKIDTLQDLVDRYNALGEAGQKAVLEKIITNRPTDGYARSQATTDALEAALTKVETEINKRLTITSVSIADNKAYASTAAGEGKTVRVLGYGVGINLNTDSSGKKVSDTTSIVIELYNEETLLGKQILNETGRNKHADKSVISGTIDAGGQYKATSWDNSWSVGIAVIPTKAVATVHYSDGTAIAEKALNFTEEQTKIFYAAEKVHALFENVYADTLVLADGVTKDTIDAASVLVEAITINPTQNKAALEELIDKAWTLLGATKVTDENSLTAALGSEGSNIIVLGNDISLSSTASISKDVTIIGNGRTISGAFFNVQSGNVVFENVKFQGAGSSGSQDAIQVRSGASATVKDCDFNGLYRGINAYFGSTITIQNNNFTDVYRCIIAGMGPAGDNANVSVTDISGNTFNLGFEHNSTGKYARGVSYNTDSAQGKGSLSEAVSHMLDNNTFTGDSNVDLDHKVRFYSGYQNYVNQPITDGTSDNVTVVNGTASEVIPSDEQRELVLGKITVTVSESGMTATELSNKLTKADFVEDITVNDSSGNETIADGGRVYVKSKDGKDTNYYIVKIENAEANA